MVNDNFQIINQIGFARTTVSKERQTPKKQPQGTPLSARTRRYSQPISVASFTDIERQSCRPSQIYCYAVFLLLVFCKNFPTHSTDPGFQTQTAHDALQQQVLAACARQHGLNFDLIRVLNIIALQRLEEQRLSTQGMKQESAHVGSLARPGADAEEISNLQIGGTGSPV
jgi:hypothetical protein